MPESDSEKQTMVIGMEEYNLYKKSYQAHNEAREEIHRLKDELKKSHDEFKRAEEARQQMATNHKQQLERLSATHKEDMQNKILKLKQELGLKAIDERTGDNHEKRTLNEPKESSKHNSSSDGHSKSNLLDDGKRKKSKKLKKTKKQVQIETQDLTVDSIYGLSEHSENDSLYDDSSSDSDFKKGIRLVTELPKVEPFSNKRGQDIHQFFKDYEDYCQQKYYGRKNLWVRGLEESLSGSMLKAYQAMIVDSGFSVKYESLKNRLIRQANRMKKFSYHDPRKNFDSISMKQNETAWEYAHRLETAAIEKFGDEFIEDKQKDVLRKFLDTVPENVRRTVNKQRKLRKQLGAKPYTWNDVLQDLEEDNGDLLSKKSQDMWVDTASAQPKVYALKDALKAGEQSEEVQTNYIIKAIFENTRKLLETSSGHQGRARSHER